MDICKEMVDLERELKADMYGISYSKELVEDSFQDAYIKIHNYVENGREFYGNKQSVKALLKFTCRNILLDKLRKKSREKVVYTDESRVLIDYNIPDENFEEPETDYDDPTIKNKLNRAFKKMTHDTYMTYVLRRKGMKFKDIAYLTDTSLNTALGRMRYATLKIQDEFDLQI